MTTLTADRRSDAPRTAFAVIGALSFCHMLNDMMQSLIPAIYPMLKSNFALDFGQIGLLTFSYQATASLLQPLVGLYTDKHRQPYSLAVGMGFTFMGLLIIAHSGVFWQLILGACTVGIGSAIFHPDSSRVARMAAGGRPGLAQSLFQVGGNFGTSLGPLLAAFIVLRNGQGSVAWFSAAALLAMFVLVQVGNWSRRHQRAQKARRIPSGAHGLSQRRVVGSIAILLALVFSKYVYLASLTSYYTFYLIDRFHVSVQSAQVHLFVFLAAVAAGTVIGGPIGDRIGRKYVIWGSILGVLPFTLALPYASLMWTGVLTAIIGLVLASAFSAIIVYAQELVPGKVGLMAGMFFGFAFGMGGIGAAALGAFADWKGIGFVYHMCSFLPAFGLLALFLPDLDTPLQRMRAAQNSR